MKSRKIRLLLISIIALFSLILISNLVSAEINHYDKCWILENNTETILEPTECQINFNDKIKLELKSDFLKDYNSYEKNAKLKESLKEKWSITNNQIDKIKDYPIKLYYKHCIYKGEELEPQCVLVDISSELKKKTINLVLGEGFDFSQVPFKDGFILKIGFNTITYTAGTNLITLDDSAGAGDSWGTAYDMDDVLSACGAVVTKQGANAYDISARMHFLSGVYFVSKNEFVELRPNPANVAYTIQADAGSHIRLGEYNVADKYSYNGAFWRIYINSITGGTGNGNLLKGEFLVYGSNIWTDVTSYTKGLHFVAGAKIRLNNSIIKTKSYLWAIDTDIQDVKWYSCGATYDMLVASGPNFNWAGLTTMGCNYGVFFSATTTSAVDMYDTLILNSGSWDIFLDTVDIGSASRNVAPGDTFTTVVSLTLNDIGTYYFKARVYYGTETSDALDQFTSRDAIAGGGGRLPNSIQIEFIIHSGEVNLEIKDLYGNHIYSNVIASGKTIDIPKGTYNFIFSAEGYKSKTITKEVYQDTILEVKMDVSSFSLPGVNFCFVLSVFIPIILIYRKYKK